MIPWLLLLDDGNLTRGGAPVLLAGHASVRMLSERVDLWVDSKNVKVRCNFTFVNDGPKTQVRMGFPDDDDIRYTNEQDRNRAIPCLENFKSWVNGKRVPTRPDWNKETLEVWHVKTVTFPAHGTVQVRDEYSHPIGGGATTYMDYADPGCDMVSYVLWTGASWKGTIGTCDVRFHFKLPGVKKIKAVSFASVSASGGTKNDEKVAVLIPRGTVVYEGPAQKPIVEGTTVRWMLKDFKPKSTDNPILTFNYVKKRVYF